MTVKRLVPPHKLASLGPEIWDEPALKGGRTTVDGSLTALPRPTRLHPLLMEPCVRRVGPL